VALETGNFIADLVITNPTGTDQRLTADDHIRLIKKTVKQSFSNIDGEVSASQGEINLLRGLTTTPLQNSQLSASGGVASLDTNRKLPVDQLTLVAVRRDAAQDITKTHSHVAIQSVLVTGDQIRAVNFNASATANFDGPVSSRVEVMAGATMDVSVANSFVKGVSAPFSLAFTNAITSKATGFYVRFSAGATGAIVKLPSTIRLKNGGSPPSFTSGKNYVLVGFSDDGTTFRGAFLSGFEA